MSKPVMGGRRNVPRLRKPRKVKGPVSAPGESAVWFTAIFENAMDGIVIANADDYRLRFGNASFCRMLGYEPEEVGGLRVMDLHPEKDLAFVMADFHKHVEGVSENLPVKRKDGSVFYADITVAPFEADGVRYLAGFFRDITERKQAEELLRESEAELAGIVEHSPIAMLVTAGADNQVKVMNRRFTALFGYTIEDVHDVAHWWILAYPNEQYRKKIAVEWQKRVETGMKGSGEIEPMEATVTCRDGSIRYSRFTFASIGSRHIVTFDDFTARKAAEEELQRIANTDSLTGVANRREFARVLKKEIARAGRYGVPLSIISYDLDHFKWVNDEYGHDVGDSVLRATSRLVTGHVRATDLVARWGGEEFLVLTPDTDLAAAKKVAENLRQAIAQHRFDKVDSITVSFGVSQFSPSDDQDTLLKRADDALYQAKARGRNRVEALDSGASQ